MSKLPLPLKEIQVIKLNISSKYKHLFRKDETLSYFSPIHICLIRSTSQPKYSNPITVQLGVVLGWISFSCALELSSPVTDQRRWIWLHIVQVKNVFLEKEMIQYNVKLIPSNSTWWRVHIKVTSQTTIKNIWNYTMFNWQFNWTHTHAHKC